MNEKMIGTEQGLEVVANENEDRNEQAAVDEVVESWSDSRLGSAEITELQLRWNSIQKMFVDEPLTSVEQADALVSEVEEKIAKMLSERRAVLSAKWVDHGDITTEDLRIALQSYRSFFDYLLTL